MNVVVTGGSGGVGREVVARLRRQQVRTVAASRRTGVDLATGEGLAEVLADASVVVHLATNARFRRVDLDGTRRMIEILRRRADPPHLLYLSIVGCDRNPFLYYRAKYACELVLERSGLPVTVVRATQFHTLLRSIGEVGARGPVAVVPKDLAFQSCDPRWVADELVTLVLADAPLGYRRTSDLAGPERTTIAEVIELSRRAAGRRPGRLLTLPAVGGALRAFAAGANLPDPDAKVGGVGYRAWLRNPRPAGADGAGADRPEPGDASGDPAAR
jgi:uncharacterized protein YbjT (DUF2867 family)